MRVCLVFGKIRNLLWRIFNAFGQIVTIVISQILNILIVSPFNKMIGRFGNQYFRISFVKQPSFLLKDSIDYLVRSRYLYQFFYFVRWYMPTQMAPISPSEHLGIKNVHSRMSS